MRIASGVMRNVGAVVVSSLLLGAVATPAGAISLLSGYEGLPGADGTYGEFAMPPNDDGSSNALSLPFDVNFFGNTFNTFFINNNGNVTFNGPVSGFTPQPFPIANRPMIAPYWGDVDTRTNPGDGSNRVYVAAPNDETTVVTWDRVGFYSGNNSKQNSFQLVLRDRSMDTGTAGDFDVEFRYEQLQWTTGNASGGTNGLGGTPAQAGFDAGDNINFETLPGSRTAAVLDLQNTSNVSATTPGLWSFAIRNGALPGSTPANPLMPVIVDDSFVFDFNVDLDQVIWSDPDVAVGYDFSILSGPAGGLFESVEVQALPGDDMFTLLYDDGGGLQSVMLMAGMQHFFSNPVSMFRIEDIDVSEMLDPTDTAAFVWGSTYTVAGRYQTSQTPITVFIPGPNDNAVPEPVTGALSLMGLAALAGAARRRRAA